MSEQSAHGDLFEAERVYDQLRERGLLRKGSLTMEGCRCRAGLEARRGTDKAEFLAALAESFPTMPQPDLAAIGSRMIQLANGEIIIDFAFGSLSDSYLFMHHAGITRGVTGKNREPSTDTNLGRQGS